VATDAVPPLELLLELPLELLLVVPPPELLLEPPGAPLEPPPELLLRPPLELLLLELPLELLLLELPLELLPAAPPLELLLLVPPLELLLELLLEFPPGGTLATPDVPLTTWVPDPPQPDRPTRVVTAKMSANFTVLLRTWIRLAIPEAVRPYVRQESWKFGAGVHVDGKAPAKCRGVCPRIELSVR
jgi:hypothetical protein